MTDDHDQLTTLFRQAAGDPPPGFDHDAVVTRSRQVTARRRSALLGSTAVLAVVLGVGVVVGQTRSENEAASTAAAPPAAERDSDAAAGAEQAPSPFIADSPESGGLAASCAPRNDPALRALVDEALPEVAGAPEAATTDVCRPGGAREVNLQVTDGTVFGRLLVVSLPAGEEAPNVQDGASATAPTASGGTVVVASVGDAPGAVIPFAGRLADIATALAPLL